MIKKKKISICLFMLYRLNKSFYEVQQLNIANSAQQNVQ